MSNITKRDKDGYPIKMLPEHKFLIQQNLKAIYNLRAIAYRKVVIDANLGGKSRDNIEFTKLVEYYYMNALDIPIDMRKKIDYMINDWNDYADRKLLRNIPK